MRVIVERVRGRNRDRHGNLAAPSSPLRFRAFYAPGESVEDSEQRESTETRAVLYSHRIDLDVTDLDHIVTPAPVAGTWVVDGEPQQWLSPYTGRLEGTVIRLKKFRG
ncbi:hypothetical protein [Brevibacterium otitidis]|uniref:Head-to-tail stopper n=1 Tax=Brevibacterium otitidis TaxID=53364 RepID=A0ABV5X1X9_9MICO|nr:hypothetical protein GCM10023233_22690 [Brevibacterium otitidis]